MRGTAELGAVTAATAPLAPARLVSIGDQGLDVQARLDRIALGSELSAVLRERYADGSFRVELAGTALRMQVPAGTDDVVTITGT